MTEQFGDWSIVCDIISTCNCMMYIFFNITRALFRESNLFFSDVCIKIAGLSQSTLQSIKIH